MKIVDMGINGEGIAKEDGKVFFIKGALPNEDVEVKNVEEKSKFAVCEIAKIKTKSKFRVIPECIYFNRCGGCQLQHLKYENQLEYKTKLVKETLKKVGGIDVEVQKCIASDLQYNYRNKNVFPCFIEKGSSQFGMYKFNSHEIIHIEECKIASNGINKILKLSNEFLKNKQIDCLRYLVVREIDSYLLITWVVSKEDVPYLNKYLDMLKINCKNFSFNININKSENEILSDKFVNIFGENEINYQSNGLKGKVNSGSFLQINNNIKDKLYQQILDCFDKTDYVIDSYCGTGYLSFLLARKVRYCYGIEICKDAIQEANKMQIENNLSNLYFIHGDCNKEIPKLLPNIEDEFSIILDPPRKGCSQEVLKSIIDVEPKKIIYVSCNPISLAQDLKILMDKYTCEKIQPFDMFPQTTNVETLVILKNKTI